MPIPSHLVAQGPQTRNIYRIPCYLRVELVLPGLNPASRQEALDAESTKRNPSTACCCQVGASLAPVVFWGHTVVQDRATWEGLGSPRHLLFVTKSLRPLTALNISRWGRSKRARLQLLCRTDGQGNRVAFPDELPDVRPENRRHGPVSFPTCLQSLQTLERPS